MATFRFPILIWQNANDSFTAQAVTGDEEYFPPAAFSERKDLAVSEVKEYLQWKFEDEWWRERMAILPENQCRAVAVFLQWVVDLLASDEDETRLRTQAEQALEKYWGRYLRKSGAG